MQQKIFSISFDNASNNTSDVQRLKIKYDHICNDFFFHSRCVAHIINLIVQDSLNVQAVSQLKEDFKNMLRDVICTTKRRYVDYRKLCRETNQSCYGPNFDLPTRWNSTWKMFESAI